MSLAVVANNDMRASRVAEHIDRRFRLRPRLGIEREFYVTASCRDEFLLRFRDTLLQASSSLLDVSLEEGENQFEYSLRESEDLDALTAAAHTCDRAVEKLALAAGGKVLWDAQPFCDEPTSGLHVHVTLHDHAGINQLVKPEDGNAESFVMLASVAGLLSTMRPLMLAFAPSERCYARFQAKPYPEVMFSPISVSWAADNRSAALRLPGSGAMPDRRRIEHRVASSHADLETVLVCILTGIWAGLDAGKAPDQPKMLGLANRPAAREPRLPATRESAQKWFASDGASLLSRLAGEMALSTRWS